MLAQVKKICLARSCPHNYLFILGIFFFPDMAKPESRAGSVMNLVTGGLEWTNLGNPWDNVVFPFDKYADRMSYNFWGGKGLSGYYMQLICN